MNQNRMMASFLAGNPEQLTAICELVNEQQRGHKAIAEGLSGDDYPLRAVTPTDLIKAVNEKGPEAILDLFVMLHGQHEAIMDRVAHLQHNLQAILEHPKVAEVLPAVISELESKAEETPVDPGEEE